MVPVEGRAMFPPGYAQSQVQRRCGVGRRTGCGGGISACAVEQGDTRLLMLLWLSESFGGSSLGRYLPRMSLLAPSFCAFRMVRGCVTVAGVARTV